MTTGKDDTATGRTAPGKGGRFARGRRIVRRRRAYRRWRTRVPIVFAGRRAPRAPQPWYARLIRASIAAVAAFGLVVVMLAGLAAFLGGRAVILPVWAVAEVETRVNRALEGRVLVALGGVEAAIGPGGTPQVVLDDLRLKTPEGMRLAILPEVRVEFDRAALLRASPRPTRLVLSGARMDLRRDAEGRFDLRIEGPEGDVAALDLPQVMAVVWQVLDLPILQGLARIEAEAMSLSLMDERVQRSWTVGDGRAVVLRQGEGLALDLGMGLVGGDEAPATAQITLILPRDPADDGAGRLLARFEQVAASDLALQAGALAFLRVIDAPISGELRVAFDGQARLLGLEGGLVLGAGALRPVADVRPVALERAELMVAFDPATARLDLTNLEIDSPALRVRARGHVDVQGIRAGVPEAFVGQITLSELVMDPDGVFSEPLRFGAGAMDMRLRLDPFSIDLGQLSLDLEGNRLLASGGVSASDAGWSIALEVGLDAIRADRLLALWPVSLVPGTRAWLTRNVLEGMLTDVKAGLRLRPEHEPRLSLGYEFAGADVRILPGLPIISDGHGHAALEGKVYTLSLERGHMDPPEGGRVDVARSVFQVPDVTVKPTLAKVVIRTDSSITAALSLLDQPPFGYLGAAGMVPDLAEGRARLTTRLQLPLTDRFAPEDVQFTLDGQMEGVRSTVLVPGHVLKAERLQIEGDPKGIAVFGAGTVSDVGFDGRWDLPLGKGRVGSRLSADVDLTRSFGRAFLPALGADALGGSGKARLAVTLAPGSAPKFSLTSDLAGVAVSVAALGWTLPARSKGKLEASGTLGAQAAIDSFVLEGPGLAAKGAVRLRAGGALDLLTLERLRLGAWLDARVEVGADGAARITGGAADLRKMPEGAAMPGGASGGTPMQVQLDELRLSDSITLTNLTARLAPARGGMTGSFSARVAGKVPVTGTLQPGRNGPRIVARTEDGGGAMAAAGLFSKARGGVLDLDMAATGRPGHYAGVVRLTQFRVREVPALAELLGAISIVGLIDQLGGEGVGFDLAEAKFRLTPTALELRDSYATGASFGLTLEGIYHLVADRFEMQGVLSPLYIVNAIGQAVSRTGEGLVGVNFKLAGSSVSPAVSINPLSAIAPGFLRELFRGRPATLEDLE